MSDLLLLVKLHWKKAALGPIIIFGAFFAIYLPYIYSANENIKASILQRIPKNAVSFKNIDCSPGFLSSTCVVRDVVSNDAIVKSVKKIVLKVPYFEKNTFYGKVYGVELAGLGNFLGLRNGFSSASFVYKEMENGKFMTRILLSNNDFGIRFEAILQNVIYKPPLRETINGIDIKLDDDIKILRTEVIAGIRDIERFKRRIYEDYEAEIKKAKIPKNVSAVNEEILGITKSEKLSEKEFFKRLRELLSSAYKETKETSAYPIYYLYYYPIVKNAQGFQRIKTVKQGKKPIGAYFLNVLSQIAGFEKGLKIEKKRYKDSEKPLKNIDFSIFLTE